MVISSRVLTKAIELAGVAILLSSAGLAQTASLSLASGSGARGSVVNLNLSLTSTVSQPAAVQWTVTYLTSDFSALTVTAGAVATAAGKSISCNNTSGVSKCVVYGVNSNTMASGVVATLAFTISGSTTNTSSAIQVTNQTSATLAGLAMTSSASGSTVTILPTVTGISCTPDSVIPPAPSTCLVTISSAAPSGGTSVALSDDTPNAIIQPTLSIPTGATSASFPVATSVVTSNTTANVTATLGSSSASFPLWLVAPAQTGITTDATVSQNSTTAGTSITSPALSTTSTYELLLALVSGGPASGVTVSSVTGAGLSWVLVQRTNAQGGTAEIWRAFSPTVLSNATVTANFSTNVFSSITVMTFAGVDPSGANGSGAIGAAVSASAASGAPTATLTTTRDNSLVVGVGTDAASAVARTPGSNQNLVSSDLAPNNNTYWVQTQINTTPLSGTSVSVNDISPTSDKYNLTAVEILPPSYCIPTLVPVTRSFQLGGGASSAVVATGTGCAWTSTTDSPSWITFSSGSGNGNGSFTFTIAANATGLARLGTITVGTQSFKVMEAGSTQQFTDVAPSLQYFDYITLMYANGITAGCNTSPLMYCPNSPVTRAQMAVFVVAALDVATGSTLTYGQTPYFQDLPSTNPFFPFVQRIKELGITAGCSSNPPMFCPDQSITLDQMSVFMVLSWMQVKGLTTFTYTQTPYFTDVPATNPFFKYIQKMMDMQFWTGCGGNQYCPSTVVTRAVMAPMVTRAILGAP
jgi:hypothetical protein